jgi:lipoprotein-anchoring transpeptidase ErfK/SrfK/uncharacterized protein YehS (DUF1456 family)
MPKSKKAKNQKSIVILKRASGIFLALFIFVGIIIGSFFGYEKAYAGKILLGVKVGGLNIGGESKQTAKVQLDKYLSDLSKKNITIISDNQINNVKLGDLGITFNSQNLIDQAYNIGRENNYQLRFTHALAAFINEKNITLVPSVDQTKSRAALEKISSSVIKESKDAYFKLEGDNLVTVLSEEGKTINLDVFQNDVKNLVAENLVNNKIVLQYINTAPKISNDDLSKIKPEAERIIQDPIVLTYNYKKYTASKEEIVSWLSLQKNNYQGLQIAFNNDEINSYIETIAQKIDQKSAPKKIRSDNNEVVDEGRDGFALDRDKALSDIKNILIARQNQTETTNQIALEVTTTSREEQTIAPENLNVNGGTPGLYDSRYIEVDLSTQTMYLWEGSNQVASYTVSTGKWSMPTPTGTRYIESKDERAYSAKYDLYMPWWNSIGGGYGIHELPEWANGTKEGESHLGTPVSHGCIRLGVGAAEFVYNWAAVGTPVYIHK